MTSIPRRRFARRRHVPGSPLRSKRPDERGQAVLIGVIIFGLVVAVVGTTVFNTAVDNVTTSAHDVEANQALQAAQSGLDAVYQQISAAAAAADMPCGSAITGTLGSAPYRSSYSVTLTYYSTLTSKVQTTCSSLASAKGVELVSVGTDLNQTATMDSEANITTAGVQTDFPDAIFTGANLTFNGADQFYVTNKTVYVIGTVTCTASGTVHAKQVTVIGKFTGSGACPVTGTVEATGAITLAGSASTGTLISTGSTISISGNPTVNGSMYAKSTISIPTSNWKTKYTTTKHQVTVGGTKSTVYYTVNANDSSLTAPPTQNFPTFNWTPTGWNGKSGWKSYTAGSTCKAAYKDMFLAHTATATGTSKNIALYTTCAIALPPSASPMYTYCPTWAANRYYCTKLPLARSLAIFDPTGITVNTTGASPSNIYGTGGTRTLFLVVPTDKKTGAATSCASTGGKIKVSGTIGAEVNVLLYTPCTITITGASAIAEGEIYSGSTFAPRGGMKFGTPPTNLPGAAGGLVAGGTPLIGIIYEREVS